MKPTLPQFGWFLDLEWTDCLYGKLSLKVHERKLKTFRKNIRDTEIPHFSWGDNLVIHTEDFYGRPSSGTANSTEPRLPQRGVFSDKEWAAAFDEEVSTFRDKVRKYNVKHIKFGAQMLVDAADFFEGMKQDT